MTDTAVALDVTARLHVKFDDNGTFSFVDRRPVDNLYGMSYSQMRSKVQVMVETLTGFSEKNSKTLINKALSMGRKFQPLLLEAVGNNEYIHGPIRLQPSSCRSPSW